jgi:ribonuclease R
LIEELNEAGDIERAPGARYRVPGLTTLPEAPSTIGAPITAEPSHARPTGRPGIVGRIRVHPAGYGFVEREDGEADVFVAARFRGTALDGDRVRLTTWTGHKGVEGRVEEVVARGRAKLTGLVKRALHDVFLEPDDPRIASTYGRVALEAGGASAREGQCVVAEITRYPTSEGGAGLTARIMHVLGDDGDPRTEVAKVIACADIPDQFPDDVLAAARKTAPELGPADFADRIDLRDREFLTIDPETARDFDDAVCVEDRAGGGWRVWVAVADVSHYVTAGGALDREARIRGCSVYLPDRAISMLPHELSAGICSLNPEVDRCAMVTRIDYDVNGIAVGEPSFCAAVIKSHARLDYPGVAAALAGDFRGPRARYRPWHANLERMNRLARLLRAHRRTRGSLDFDLPEAFVVLDEDDPRRVRDVRRSKADEGVKVAYQMIEEYMLAANEAVGSYFQTRGYDAVWRVHDVPSLERLEAFADLARGFGLDFEASQGQSPLAVAGVLKEMQGKTYERALNFMLLRSLKQAAYDVVNVGHFGLASRAYLHFTSPIRRYPDLIVHRLLKHHLRREGQASGGATHATPPPREVLAEWAAESSSHERRAVEAEREVVDMYRAFLMRDRVQEELDGIVSGVTNFGLFIECTTPYVEGLIKLDRLHDGGEGGDAWIFDEKTLRLVGRRSGRFFSLGDPVRVRVDNVSVARRRIDLSLVEGGRLGGELPEGQSRYGEQQQRPPARRPHPSPVRRGRDQQQQGKKRDRDARDRREDNRGGGGGGKGGRGKGGKGKPARGRQR